MFFFGRTQKKNQRLTSAKKVSESKSKHTDLGKIKKSLKKLEKDVIRIDKCTVDLKIVTDLRKIIADLSALLGNFSNNTTVALIDLTGKVNYLMALNQPTSSSTTDQIVDFDNPGTDFGFSSDLLDEDLGCT